LVFDVSPAASPAPSLAIQKISASPSRSSANSLSSSLVLMKATAVLLVEVVVTQSTAMSATGGVQEPL
jgi:hypothetical protein